MLCLYYDVDRHFYVSRAMRRDLAEETRQMFVWAFDSYMQHAFPFDELDPIHCTGRGQDKDNLHNININDVLGDYSLTLIDSLDSLVMFGNASEFRRAVRIVSKHVSFAHSANVQVFEATIRVLGGLVSAHSLIEQFGHFGEGDGWSYDGELLNLAHDLITRMMPAFEKTGSGLPYPRIDLLHGVQSDVSNETVLAGAGTLFLEFFELSRLTNDPVFAQRAKRILKLLFNRRSPSTGLLGYAINVQTGEWVNKMSGLGAGMDSFYEYLLKAAIVSGDKDLAQMYKKLRQSIRVFNREGRRRCRSDEGGEFPRYVNVLMDSGSRANTWIDSLAAAWAANAVLDGDVDDAICQHLIYYTLWRKYSFLPERFNFQHKSPDYKFYPLRPEFAESTYFLYRATKNVFYLHVGIDILRSFQKYAVAECGYATIHDVETKEQEDRMESFFLAETCKYLYLLFDGENRFNRPAIEERLLFSTEGHAFLIPPSNSTCPTLMGLGSGIASNHCRRSTDSISQCENLAKELRFDFPTNERVLREIEDFVGIAEDERLRIS